MRNFFCAIFFFLCSAPEVQSALPQVKLEPFVSSGIQDPLFIIPLPGAPVQHLVIEQPGRLRTIEGGVLNPVPFLDIEDHVLSGGEQGLLGVALHPDYMSNGRYFINYTTEEGGQRKTIVSELHEGSRKERRVMEFAQPYSNHNGGHLAFGADGYLYISAGDGGSANDPHGNGQSKRTLLGKILRIDVNGAQPYSIPKDNPFLGEAQTRPEIYAYGLRNVWRFSFDKLTGALFAGDVGQNKWEEIDIIERGGNYGWNTMEGKHCFNPEVNCNTSGLILPIFEYPRSQGVSVTGGYVYRGKKIAGLEGVYVYGDYGSGKIWGIRYDQTTKTFISNELLLNSHLPISSFGEDVDGELFVVGYNGTIYRLVPKGI